MKYLIVGLGNIGAEYAKTRHNIGFMILDHIAEKENVTFGTDKLGFVTNYKHKGRTVYLLKPSTYMNLSGKAVRYWMNELKLTPENVLIITDDIALPYHKQRLRKKGSAGGHNGLKSIEELLQTNEYPRLKIGVGDDFSKGKQVDFVLGEFSSKESEELSIVLDKAKKTVESFVTIGIDRTMNFHND